MNDAPDTADSYKRLHRSGWSMGSTAFAGPTGHTWLLVYGRNGENQVRAEGATEVEAWQRAVEQARELGMSGKGDR
jgi:hypothetical protein